MLSPGTEQLLDRHLLPQPVQSQDGVDGRHAFGVFLDERLPVPGLLVLARGGHDGQGLAVLELLTCLKCEE